ncbi:MAG: metallophosphoesterase [Saprospiraceae bacterium]
MKIAIISDIHENFHNLILGLQEMEKHGIEQIICLGDLMNSGVAKLLATQSIPVFMIWGNNDGEKVEITLASKKENSVLTVSTKVYDFLALGGRKIFISHYEDLAQPMAKSGEYDAVFSGHTHIVAKAKIKDCWVVNPGEISAGKTKKATFAIYDTVKNEVEIITLKNSITLKTPLMEAYFKANGAKMGLRSRKAFGLMQQQKSVIPESSSVYQILAKAAKSAKAVVFSGLPGVGKSLYINQFQLIAAAEGKKVTVIQWDIARKSFETKEIATRYPMGPGIVHNGVKLSVGKWLIATIKKWLANHSSEENILLIEAPLVGHRFIELASIQADTALETFFKSNAFQMIVPIPSKKVRAKIEADRRAQVAEDAKVWTGAKPSVMLMLWKMICGIANEFGRHIPMDGQPPYDPEVYDFVFGKILQHRHFSPLHIEEIYPVSIENEADLHNTDSLAADAETANQYAEKVATEYPDLADIDKVVEGWYLT